MAVELRWAVAREKIRSIGQEDAVKRFDVAVVGGGIAGVSVAYELAADRSVVLVEQEDQLATHTTGRSAAAYIPTYGNEVVRALTRASRADFERIGADQDAPPLLTPRRLMWLDTHGTPEAREALRSHDASPVAPSDVPSYCPILRPDAISGAAIADAMDIDVMALHGAYVRGLVARSGRIERSARVTGLRRVGDRWHVDAGPLSLRVDVVVNAAGAWGDTVAELAGVAPIGLRPLRRTLFVAPIPDRDTTGWPLVIDGRERFYFKPEAGSLLVSPGDETPVSPDARGYEDVDIARAMDALNEVTSLRLRRVSAAWAGLRTFAPDRSPVVGEMPGVPGFLWFAGQGGYGIQMAPALARTAAAILRTGDLPEDVAAEGVAVDDLAPSRFEGRVDSS